MVQDEVFLCRDRFFSTGKGLFKIPQNARQ